MNRLDHNKSVLVESPDSRPFPMLDGDPITWAEVQDVYRIYVCLFHNGQSLSRIAQRGGFGHDEIKYLRTKHEDMKARGQCSCTNNLTM